MRILAKSKSSWSRRVGSAGIAAGLAFLVACGPSREYTVEMRVEDGRLLRILTFSESGGSSASTDDHAAKPGGFADAPRPSQNLHDELDRLAAAYGGRAGEAVDKEWRFQGRFLGDLPGDLGGSGSFTRYVSPFGAASVYAERLRGDDNPIARLEAQARAVDRLVDYLIGWSGLAFRDHPALPKLRKFLDEDLRRDIKNLGLHGRQDGFLDGRSSEESATAFLVRSGLYLAERGYFEIGDLPRLSRGFEEDDQRATRRLVRDLFARRMEVEPESLVLFDDPQKLEASLNDYFVSTDEYRKLVVEWTVKQLSEPDLPRPEPWEALQAAMGAFTDTTLNFGRRDPVAVTLELPDKPLRTNGRWEGGRVIWSETIERDGDHPAFTPALLHAVWVEPEGEGQRRRFGEVLVTGETLFQFCFRWQALSEVEQDRFRESLGRLPSPEQLKKRFDELRASSTKPGPSGEAEIDAEAFSKRALEEILSLLPDNPFEPKR